MPGPLYPIIPYPQSIQLLPGSLKVPTLFGIFYHPIFLNEVRLFQEKFPESQTPQIVYLKEEASLFLHQIESPDAKPGSYELEINPQQISIYAQDKNGIFLGLQTVFQLISFVSHQFSITINLPCLKINDSPKYLWRGFMLDEARHFQGAQTIYDLLDWMAYLKMNVFHWHLSDDQGWRIEINRYPQLVEIGSQRTCSHKGGLLSKRVDSVPHQGHYSQDEIRSIVAYAAERFITIVPEIDIPGHSSAILAAYPEYGCTGGPYIVQPYWGIHKDILCAGNPSTLPFLQGIFSEILDLFPGQYIHTGGDEAPKTRWQQCPKCQALARDLGYSSVNRLQTYLANNLNSFLQNNNRTMLGWNEVLADDLSPDVMVQYWMGNKKTLISHIENGRKVILSNYNAYYLDHTYTHSSLSRVYQFEPVFPQLENELHNQILGIEAPLWTEYVPSRPRLDWQIFPRLLAVAESAWSGSKKENYPHFKQRLKGFLPEMDHAGIQYAPLSETNPNFLQRLKGPISLLQENTRVRSE